MKAARLRIAAQLVAAMIIVPSTAASQVLNFEGIATSANPSKPIGNYYNGGAGPNFGVEFSSNASALCLNTLLIHCSNSSRGGFVSCRSTARSCRSTRRPRPWRRASPSASSSQADRRA